MNLFTRHQSVIRCKAAGGHIVKEVLGRSGSVTRSLICGSRRPGIVVPVGSAADALYQKFRSAQKDLHLSDVSCVKCSEIWVRVQAELK